MMKLYYRPGACSMAVHVLLEDLGADYEAIAMSGEVLASEKYRKSNRRNQVPSLITEWSVAAASSEGLKGLYPEKT